MLTFVIAGGGFAGVELAGALNDFSRGILADYPNLSPSDVRIMLVHSRERILPELSESLGRYARESMELRGVTFRLNCRLTDCRPGCVVLSDGEVRSRTLVWTAGTAPNPLLKTLGIETDRRGAVVVESTMSVAGTSRSLGVGRLRVAQGRQRAATLSSHGAVRAARGSDAGSQPARLAAGRRAKPFHFDSLGALCVVGHHTACAELSVPFARGKSVRFRGLLAWLLWRGIYLGKLPGLERKDPGAHRLGHRTVFPARHRSDHRFKVNHEMKPRRHWCVAAITGVAGGVVLMLAVHANIVLRAGAGRCLWRAVRYRILQSRARSRLGIAMGPWRMRCCCGWQWLPEHK